MRLTVWTTLILLLASVSLRAQTTQPADLAARHFEVMREAWKRLRGGFRYEGTTRYATFLQRNADGSVKRYEQPVAEEGILTFAAEEKGFYVHIKMADGKYRELYIDGENISKFDRDENEVVTVKRTTWSEDSFIRAPLFEPAYIWEQWLGYPWPASNFKQPPFTIQVVRDDNGELVVEVRNDWTDKDGKSHFATRRYVLREVHDLGMLPVFIENRHGDGTLLRDTQVDWDKYVSASGAVPIPVRLVHREYVWVGGGQSILNSESSYKLNIETFELKAPEKREGAWRTLGESSELAARKRTEASATHETARPYLAGFVVFLGITTAVASIVRNRRHAMRG